MSGNESAARARFLFASQTYLIFLPFSLPLAFSIKRIYFWGGERYAYQRELRFQPWLDLSLFTCKPLARCTIFLADRSITMKSMQVDSAVLTFLATIVVCLHVTSGNIQQPSLPTVFFINSMHVSHTFAQSLTFNCTLKSHNKIICSELHWKTILVEVSPRTDADNCPPGYSLWRWQSQMMGNDIPTWRIDQCQLGILLPFGS